MSVEQAKAFIERMKTDATFRDRINSIDETAAKLHQITAEGYDCSQEDIYLITSELSDIAVGFISGGVCYENYITQDKITHWHSC